MNNLTVTVDGSGRILLPAEVRKELDLSKGSTLILNVRDDGLMLTTRAQAIQRAQEFCSRLKPRKILASEELIRDRRREARRERST